MSKFLLSFVLVGPSVFQDFSSFFISRFKISRLFSSVGSRFLVFFHQSVRPSIKISGLIFVRRSVRPSWFIVLSPSVHPYETIGLSDRPSKTDVIDRKWPETRRRTTYANVSLLIKSVFVSMYMFIPCAEQSGTREKCEAGRNAVSLRTRFGRIRQRIRRL